MYYRIVFAFCALVLIQDAFAQYPCNPCAGARGGPYAAEWEYAPAALSASNGPGVAVATASPLSPAGVSVLSENAYEGTLAVDGALPFLGTAAIEGVVPSAGAGVVAYNCGSGVIGITAENGVPLGIAGTTGSLGYGSIGAPIAGIPELAGTWGTPYAGAEPAYLLAASLDASNGRGLAVSSASSLIPSGVSVKSENVYEGDLGAEGVVPFLGTVSIEGALPTAGAGNINYGCGNGAIGITAEDNGAVGFGVIDRTLGYGAARSGWGCRAI